MINTTVTDEFEAGAITAEEACVHLAHENKVLSRKAAFYKSWCHALLIGLVASVLVSIGMVVRS
jgi:hypothetical protein